MSAIEGKNNQPSDLNASLNENGASSSNPARRVPEPEIESPKTLMEKNSALGGVPIQSEIYSDNEGISGGETSTSSQSIAGVEGSPLQRQPCLNPDEWHSLIKETEEKR